MSPPSADSFESLIHATSSPVLREIALHWNAVRGQKTMPTWADLSSTVLAPHFKWLWGFHYDPGTGDFTGRLAGTNIKDWLGANFLGASLREIHPPKVFKESHQMLSHVVTTPAAGRFHGRLFTIGGKTIEGERICLPLAADGNVAGGVLGASYYDCPPLAGPLELIHENVQWFAIG
jgi:hypothetical protein